MFFFGNYPGIVCFSAPFIGFPLLSFTLPPLHHAVMSVCFVCMRSITYKPGLQSSVFVKKYEKFSEMQKGRLISSLFDLPLSHTVALNSLAYPAKSG
jgi:hypothetical protein